MRKILLLLLLLACKLSLFASHIVGGEFELLHEQDFTYRLNMVLYFDDINGNPQARDPQVTVNIFRKSDNLQITSITLFSNTDTNVEYSNPACDPDNQILRTSRILYSNIINLSGFDDPEGYYISWERCCRNYTITNIQSNNPQSGGISAGQTFYLEFPPVIKNDSAFVNSTPKLFPPLSDFACVNKQYYTFFGGVDDDEDSLVYSMVTPYSTFDTQNAFPASPSPGPYPEVVWKNGFGLDNIVNGDPDLSISKDGLLTVTPKSTGLFVFAVQVEEFRDGVKHGAMRRDFQMLVIDDCQSNGQPSILAREKGKAGFYNEGTTLTFSSTDMEKCLDIMVIDSLTNIGADTISNVNLRIIPINFNSALEGVTIDVTQNTSIQSELDTARFTVCFPDCPFKESGFYQLGIIGYDNACPQPLLDTVVVSLFVEPPPNTRAYFAESRNGTRITNFNKVVTEQANGNLNFDINGFDAEDSVHLTITPLGFDLQEVGMSFSDLVYEDKKVTTTFNWDFDCNSNDIDLSKGRDIPIANGIRKAFDVLLILDDLDECLYSDPQQLIMTLSIDFPDQTKPTVYESSKPGLSYQLKEFNYGDRINLNILGRDSDGDRINLYGFGTGFNFDQFGMNFTNVDGDGVPGVSSNFVWEVPCPYPYAQDLFGLEFYVEDLDQCQLTNIDTLRIDLKIKEPANTPPEIFINSLNDVIISNDSIGVIVEDEIELNIIAIDAEGDTLALDIVNRSPTDPFLFSQIEGVNRVQSLFSWKTVCSDLSGPNLTREVEVTFIARDQNCNNPQGSIRTIRIYVVDKETGQTEILPPNVFTPNQSDNINEYFGMYNYDPVTAELVNILPKDNCAGQFINVIIFNRWGREVYKSTDRDFKWYGEDVASGVYFYTIQYTNRIYRGSVSVVY